MAKTGEIVDLGDLDPLTPSRTLKMKRPASQLGWEENDVSVTWTVNQ